MRCTRPACYIFRQPLTPASLLALATDELFTTPGGSNDDWYWLYAAVTAGPEGKLVTNDELRDHVFQMLPAPRLFYKWKERHQARPCVLLIRCCCYLRSALHSA